MEHHVTGSLWSLLCNCQMELYLQVADIIVHNDHKSLNKFLNDKNTNTKVNRWGLELATYNITFKWISGACNKASDCLLHLVKLPQDNPVVCNMLSATNPDGTGFNTRSQTCQHLSQNTSTSQPDVTPIVTEATNPTPKSLTTDRLQLSYKCRKQILSANEYPNTYQMEKHLSTKLISSYM